MKWKNRLRNLPIRLRIQIITMSIVFIITAANLYITWSFTNKSLSNAMEGDLTFAIEVADGLVSTTMHLLKSNAATIAEQLNRIDSIEEIEKTMEKHIATCNDCIAHSIIDDNQVVAYYGTPVEPEELATHAAELEMVKTGASVITSPFYNKKGEFVMYIYTPMDQGRILLISTSGLLFSELVYNYRLWKTGNIYILNEEGTIIADVERELVLAQRNFLRDVEEHPDTATDEEIGIAHYLEGVLSSEKGIVTYSYKGTERLCFYRRITDSVLGWSVAVAAPLDESPKAFVQNGLVWAALCFLMAGIILSFVFSAMIARPFRKIEELREVENTQRERMKILLDATPLACCLWNRDYQIVLSNEEALRMFLIKDEQEFKDRFFYHSPKYQPDGRLSSEKSLEAIKKAFTGERVVVNDWLYHNKDGVVFPAEVTLIRVLYEGEYAVAGYSRDIGEHKKMMQEIEQRDRLISTGNRAAELLLTYENEKDFKLLLLRSMGLVGQAVDADRVQIWCNVTVDGEDSFEHIHEWLSGFGRQVGPVPIGLIFSYKELPRWRELFLRGDCLNGPVSQMPPEDREFLNTFGMKSLVMIPLFLHENFWGLFSLDDCRKERVFTKDEMALLNSVSLMMANAIIHSLQAENIREAHERATVLLDAAPFGANLWDRSGRLFDCNEASVKLLGLRDKEEYLERFAQLSPVYQPDGVLSKEKSSAVILEAFTQGRSACEWTYQTPSGEIIPTEAIMVRVPYGDNLVVAGYTRDLRQYNEMIRELEERDQLLKNFNVQLEVALQESQKASMAKSDFLARMSHEMRTPLNAVIGLSELSLEDKDLAEETYSNLEKIYNSGTLLLSIVNDILDISKIEAGKLELLELPYDVPSLINDAVTYNILRIGEKPIEFVLQIDEKMFSRLYGDELRIKQIMNNLLSNAIKYTDSGVVRLSIYCTTEQDTVWLIIQVSDTGRGIKPEEVSRLFTDYSQLDLENNREIEGTGLGLPIAKKLAEMMQGTIAVESEYGEGSIFTVRIKQKLIAETHLNREVIESLKKFRYSDGKRNRNTRINRLSLPYARVLVVDDNLTNLDVAKGLMKPYDMRIDCVTSGQQAIDAISSAEVQYNAVFMDHMMPEMDGIEAADRIREIGTEYAQKLPIIALTANAVAGNEEMFLSKGFQAFLAKPIDLYRLDEVIRLWVRDKEHEEQLKNQREILRGPKNQRRISDRRSGIDRRKATLELAGLDFGKGVERFGGDEAAYLDILRSFATNTRPLLEYIENSGYENLAEYAITVHGIKGSSRGIIAEMIGDAAERLEKAAKAGDAAYLHRHNSTFLAVVWRLIYSIEEMLSEVREKEPQPTRDKPDAAILQELVAACQAYNMDAVDEAMAKINAFRYEADNGLADWLSENIKLMNFKEIIARLTENQ